MFEDVAGDEGFVDARVFVRPQVLQGIFGDALVPRSFYTATSWLEKKIVAEMRRAPGGSQTFARRHIGRGDRMWQRHERGGAGLIYI